MKKLGISNNNNFEYKIICYKQKELANCELTGWIDCIDYDNNIVYEFKCVQTLEKEHYLQLAIYMYMYENYKNKIILSFNYIYSEIDELIIRMKNIKDKINLLNSSYIKLTEQLEQNKLVLSTSYTIGDIISYKYNNSIYQGKVTKIYKKKDIIEVATTGFIKITITKSSVFESFQGNNAQKIIELKNNKDMIEKEQNELKKELSSCETNYILKMKTKNKIDKLNGKTKYVLYNILNNEYNEIQCSYDILKEIIEKLILIKYFQRKIITDSEFIKINLNLINPIV